LRLARNFGGDLDYGEARPAGGERHQGQSAQFLGAVAAIAINVAFTLDQHPMSALRQETEREMVGQGPARHKYRQLLAEQFRHALFELLDRAAQRKLVGCDPLIVGEPRQQPGIFGRRQTETVGTEMDRAVRRVHPAAVSGGGARALRHPRVPGADVSELRVDRLADAGKKVDKREEQDVGHG
jgi:hypothetical protein